MSGLPRTGGGEEREREGSEREIDVSPSGGWKQRLLVSWEHCNNNNSSVCMYVCVSDRVNELEWKWGCVMAHKSDEMTSPLLRHTAAIAAKNTLFEISDLLFSLVRSVCSPVMFASN